MTAAPTVAAPKAVTLKLPCGFCAQGLHARCPGATPGPGGARQLCPCWAADEQYTAGHQPVRCRECGAPDELDTTLVCLDRTECLLRVEQAQAGNPTHLMIVACYGDRVTTDPDKPAQTPKQAKAAKAAAAKPKSRPCTCGCGGTTKGGAFLPGHDARFVSDLVKDVVDTTDPAIMGKRIESAQAELAEFPALLAKFNKRVGE